MRDRTVVIDTEHLTKRFGGQAAVEDLSLHVAAGEVFGFLGPNGAGKTTTVRMLAGLISKTSGSARIAGHEVGPEDSALEIRRIVGLLPENVGLYEALSPYQILDFFGQMYDCPDGPRRANIERLLRLFDLWELKDRPVATFSKGMKQKVALARALVHDPKLLFLDEPTANLDPEAAKTVRDCILALKKEGRTIFLTTHNLDEAQRICDRVAILRTRLLTVGAPDQLRASLSGHRTQVRLERTDDTLLHQVRERLSPRRVERSAEGFVVEVEDPDRENPEVVRAIVEAGGRVRSVTEVGPSFEDVYLKLVRG
ncbi:MAG: ATP-binding cassette domain-containing protein [Candidatus Lutacidiplasmatales archaeon]